MQTYSVKAPRDTSMARLEDFVKPSATTHGVRTRAQSVRRFRRSLGLSSWDYEYHGKKNKKYVQFRKAWWVKIR